MRVMEQRIDELEIRYTLQQDLIAQLSDVVARHEKELAKLRALVEELRSPRENAQLPFDPNEVPPHY
jgi:uncharacterized coiled-coil protein SlyX